MQLYTVVESNGKVDDAVKLDEFASNIDKEVSEIPYFKWGDVDMVCCSGIHDTIAVLFEKCLHSFFQKMSNILPHIGFLCIMRYKKALHCVLLFPT